MRVVTYFILLILLLLGITFSVLNAESVTVNYYVGQHTLPLSLLLVFTFTLGCIVGLLVGMIMYFRAKSQSFKLRSHIRTVEKELQNLRAMPLQNNR